MALPVRSFPEGRRRHTRIHTPRCCSEEGTKRKRCGAAYAVPRSGRKPMVSTFLSFPVAPMRFALGSGHTGECIEGAMHPVARDLDRDEAYGTSREDRRVVLRPEPLPCCLCGWDRRARRPRRLGAVDRSKGLRQLLDAPTVHEEGDALEVLVEAAHEHELRELGRIRPPSPTFFGPRSGRHRLRGGPGGLPRLRAALERSSLAGSGGSWNSRFSW
jgi:hypothetical protein